MDQPDIEAVVEFLEEQIKPQTLYPWQRELLRQLLQSDDELVTIL